MKAKTAKKPKRKPKKLTPRDLGLVDNVVLSETFKNTKKRFKTVEKGVFGYRIDGNHYGARVAVIRRADVWIREPNYSHIITSYETDPYLNPQQDPFSKDYDPIGDRLAGIALTAIRALEEWHTAREAKKR